jgi:hypothetical protein
MPRSLGITGCGSRDTGARDPPIQPEMVIILVEANELSPDWISCGIGWEPVTGGHSESRISLIMNRDAVVRALDALIVRFERARALLTGHTAPLKRGLPDTSARRKMSAAGRARIAAAQKARWAKAKAGK